MKGFNEISPLEIEGNAFKMIGKDWMLITAGKSDKINTMTASWGGFGELWFKPVVYIFIRPQRHTIPFIEKHNFFSLSFLNESFKEELTFCGKNSGKDVDKIKECNFSTVKTANNAVGIEQADLILECKKMYSDTIKKPNFIDTKALQYYPDNDYHIMYVAEITNVYKKSLAKS